MKTATAYYPARQAVSFPNAASSRQLFHKLLDRLLLAACGVGIGAMLMLVLVLL